MGAITPPREHSGSDPNENRHAQVAFRLWQIEVAFVVVLVTAWFVTLGPLPAILALVTAKHVLVALLMLGVEGDTHYRRFPRPADPSPPRLWDSE